MLPASSVSQRLCVNMPLKGHSLFWVVCPKLNWYKTREAHPVDGPRVFRICNIFISYFQLLQRGLSLNLRLFSSHTLDQHIGTNCRCVPYQTIGTIAIMLFKGLNHVAMIFYGNRHTARL